MQSVDMARLSLEPLLRPAPLGESSRFTALFARAVSHWASQASGTAWSAAMFPPPGYRAVLRKAGLCAALKSEQLPMDPDLSDRFVAALYSDEADASERLWAARLLLFLEFDEEAVTAIRRIPHGVDPTVCGWTRQLVDFIERKHGPSAGLADVRPAHPAATGDGLLTVTLSLGEVWRDLYRHRDPDRARRRLEAAGALTADLSVDQPILSDVAFFRAARYEAVVRGHFNDAEGMENLVAKVRATLAPYAADATAASSFVPLEGARRVLDVATITAMENGWRHLALTCAEEAARIDPYCARAKLLLGEARRALGDERGALDAYRDSIRYGPLEREYAAAQVLHLPAGTAGRAALTRSPQAGHSTHSVKSSAGRGADLPVYAAPVERAGRVEEGARSPMAERFAPFIELTPPTVEAPLLVHAPLFCYDALLSGSGHWFESTSLQRAMVNPFRQELAHAYKHAGGQLAVDDYRQWGEAVDTTPVRTLRDLRERSAELPSLTLSRLARLLCSLGFFDEARSVLPAAPPEGGTWELGVSHLECTRFFIDSITGLGQGDNSFARLRHLVSSFSDDERSLRMRLTLHISGMVAASRIKDHSQVAYWRTQGAEVLARYTHHDEVSDFEATLMTSRFYRAAGFLPFLTGDRSLLKSDMDTWLGLARELRGCTARESILARENLFPALESAARTLSHLGDQDGAEGLMREIAEVVDPLDSKAWLQVGDDRHRRGDTQSALEAYLRSAESELPLARVAWFKAGVCARDLGAWNDAVDCHARSLDLWPGGISPADQIRDIAGLHGLGYEEEWISRIISAGRGEG
ncbi:hypothetical protein Slala05_82140 [Streptomyces lavendulae subsp. lavendulae]|nr:hypothetical protein Slala05_82140 [Streptomyces lavendulae subsp. lavendulae]